MFKLFNSSNGLLALMFFEVFLLPVWHLGPISFKFSFLIIIYSFRKKIPKSSFILPFLALIILLWFGKFYSYLFLGEYEFQETIKITLNYFVIIGVFLYSKKIKIPNNLNWLALLALAFTFINICIFILAPKYPSITSFYNLETRLEEGLFLYRNPGINTNPNGSAMMANLILLFWVVANNNNLITLKSKFWDIIVFASIGLAIVSFVSKSGFLAYFILCVFYFRKKFSILKLFKATVPVIIVAFLISNFIKQLPKNELRVLEFGIDKIVNFDEALESEINLDQSQNGSRIFKVNAAIENFITSPVFGSGSDRSTGSVLNTVWYHNDFSEILVSTGLLGFLFYLLIVYRIFKIDYILTLPIFLPGLTNAFIFTFQIAAFYFLFVGLILKLKNIK